MKLIDLLVQKLPKRGGWVDGANEAVQDANGDIKFFDSGDLTYQTRWGNTSFWGGSPRGGFFCLGKNYIKGLPLADDNGSSIITRDQYEAALQPEWNGEGLPPVGVGAEVSANGGKTWCSYKALAERDGTRMIEIGDLTEEFQNGNWVYRPIRTEAECKRDAFAEAVTDRTVMGDSWQMLHVGHDLYDAIAAGKIPGVKLDD